MSCSAIFSPIISSVSACVTSFALRVAFWQAVTSLRWSYLSLFTANAMMSLLTAPVVHTAYFRTQDNTPCCSCFTATEPHLSFGRGKQHKERNKSIYNCINLCKANPGIKYMVYHRNLDQRYTATSCLHQSVTPQLLLLSLQQTALPQLSPPISIHRRGTSSNGTSWYSTW